MECECVWELSRRHFWEESDSEIEDLEGAEADLERSEDEKIRVETCKPLM